jgi:acetoin utilization deacetylase AcuC-like enzyme/GNAT superfamily N-acetyltransferase
MFRIRRIHDDVLPINREAIQQAKAILKDQFPAVDPAEVDQLEAKLRNPFKQRFRTILFAAEDIRRHLQGFAILLHEPRIGFCFLDYIATLRGRMGGGIGGALYGRVREEAGLLEASGLFFECLPDDPESCPDEAMLAENRARLRFYESFGARPIVGTAYEKPFEPGGTCMPHLVFDGLGRSAAPGRDLLRKVVEAVLDRKYGGRVPPGYVAEVVASITADPAALRPLAYLKPGSVRTRVQRPPTEPVPLVVNDRHAIHHVRERGYVESPVRIESILGEIEATGLFERVEPRRFPDRHVTAVHDADFVDYLRRACEKVDEKTSLYPYVFPIRNKARAPRDPSVLPGYYCIDTFTPVHRNAYPAARRAVDCTLTAAKEILEGRRLAYSLVRPPGHHAERRAFGGFCYLNSAAVAAHHLSAHGRVAILDVDYHHGNGQQDIFYRRSDVLTVSIHGHPRFAYPYFTGFEDEVGEGPGEGYNMNLPLPEQRTGKQYAIALVRALRRIEDFRPALLVVALGLDTARGDPTGTWSLTSRDLERNGRMIGEMALPVLVVQEGGYRTRTLGRSARGFLTGLAEAARLAREARPPAMTLEKVAMRSEARPGDPLAVRQLVEVTEMFAEREVEVAVELVTDSLEKGDASDYRLIIAESGGRLAGYTCYGRIACTESGFDLYWIVTHPLFQGRGLGRELLARTEHRVREAGGTRLYAETSGRPAYAPTRAFYERNGYRVASVIDDFYAPGDSRITYVKPL